MKTISFIGCGNMGSAIAEALRKSGEYEITAYDKDEGKAKALADKLGISLASTLEDALSKSETILIAVKPQVLPSIYAPLSKHCEKSFISIAAGVPLSVLKKKIGSKDIVRFMPNIAAKARAAVTAVASLESCSESFKAEAFSIAKSFGSAFPLDESLFPAFIGISGSAIAYAFEFMHAVAMGGVDAGIPYDKAVEIVRDTMVSAAMLQKEGNENPVKLMAAVCSAAGTTIKGMGALYSSGFDASLMKAVNEAAEKSIMLENKAKEDA